MCVNRCKYSANVRVGQEVSIMSGYSTTYNEAATSVTAPQTIYELRQRDTRSALAARHAGTDGSVNV